MSRRAIPAGDSLKDFHRAGGVLAAFQYCTHVAIENCTLGALT